MGKQFASVNCTYGAPMGRREFHHPEYRAAARLFRVRLDSGGYDDGGAYWGLGKEPLWCCMQRDHDFQVFFRASSRRAAAEYVASEYPGLRLFRPVPGTGAPV